MPAAMEPTQQAPMTSDNGDIVTQQPVSCIVRKARLHASQTDTYKER